MITEEAREEYENKINKIAQRAVESYKNGQGEYDMLADSIRDEIEKTEYPPLNLETVLLSDQDPDNPTHTAQWSVNFDPKQMSWNSAVEEAAYLCLFSDLVEAAETKMEE